MHGSVHSRCVPLSISLLLPPWQARKLMGANAAALKRVAVVLGAKVRLSAVRLLCFAGLGKRWLLRLPLMAN